MKILLIGYRGQLGSDLRQQFKAEDLTLTTQDQLRVEDPEQVMAYLRDCRPDLILNCSAFHRVDECEDAPERAFAVNVFGVRNLALAARSVGAKLVHFSTDYVFDDGETPHLETDLPGPRCVYAVSKLAGEAMLQAIWDKHFIVRSSGLYGYTGSREKGTNFVEMMIGLARQGKPIRVVNDQVLTPTSTLDLAAAVRQIVFTEAYGLYHLTSAGECSWYEFAVEIFRRAELEPQLFPVGSDAFPTRARRPRYSVLDNRRFRQLAHRDMAPWQDALEQYVAGRRAAGRE